MFQAFEKITAWEQKHKKVLIASIYAIILGIYLTFSLNHVGQFITTDEPVWVYERIPQYWDGILNGEFEKTYINDKPGVTLALVSGIGLFWEENPKALITEKAKEYTKYDSQKTSALYTTFRIPIIIFTVIFSLVIFWLIRKCRQNAWTALWSMTLILLSPILLGLSQIINPDALLWLFTTATFFSFVAFLKTEEKKFILLTPIFFGMALLSKYSAVILFPFLFITALFHFIIHHPEFAEQKILHKKLLNAAFFYLVTVFGAIVTFAIFVPAVFQEKEFLYYGTIGYPGMRFIIWPILIMLVFVALDARLLQSKITSFVLRFLRPIWKNLHILIYIFLLFIFLLSMANWITDQGIVRLGKIQFDEKRNDLFLRLPLYKKIIFEYFILAFSLTPLTLLSLFFIWTKSIIHKNAEAFLASVLSAFLILFYCAVIFKGLAATIRYSIILHPFIAVLASLGLASFFSMTKLKNIPKSLISVGIIGISMISLWLISPFYFNYTNSLLPKKQIITDAWGYGGYEAANYINQLPNSDKLVVWSDYSGVCEFIAGTCITNYTFNQNKYPVDYLVLTRRGKIRYDFTRKFSKDFKRYPELQIKAKPYYEKESPDFQVIIDGRQANYIKVFKNAKTE